MEFKLCKWQYTGKSETTFSIRFSNRRKDVDQTNTSGADDILDYLVIISTDMQNLP